MSQVNVRYIVSDMDEAISFYTETFDFRVDMHPGPACGPFSGRSAAPAEHAVRGRVGRRSRCRTGVARSLVAGAASRSRSRTSTVPSRICASTAPRCGVTSSRAGPAAR